MSITIDLPPAMAQEAQGYADLSGTEIGRMFLDCLADELKRRREASAVLSRLDELAKRTSARLVGEPYKFNRADAYEPEVGCDFISLKN